MCFTHFARCFSVVSVVPELTQAKVDVVLQLRDETVTFPTRANDAHAECSVGVISDSQLQKTQPEEAEKCLRSQFLAVRNC